MDLPADILEMVVSKLAAVDLLSAACVSHGWLHAVRSSLRTRPRIFPWLLLCCRPQPTASTFSLHGFDPSSHTWLSVPPPDRSAIAPTLTFLRGSSGDRLYTLSPSQLLMFQDPFAMSIPMQVKGPEVWRQDPVVAEIGCWVVVAGGGFMAQFDDEEDEGTVEVYDKQTGMWELAEPMPLQFEGSTCAAWLSVAVSDKRLYVIEKNTGWVSWFDPESKRWGPTCQVGPKQSFCKCAIGVIGKKRLLLVEAGSQGGALMKIRFWEIDRDSLEVVHNTAEEIPMELVDPLYPNFANLGDARRQTCSVEVCGTELGGYVFNPTNIKHGVVMYQYQLSTEGRSVWRWEWVPVPPTVGWGFMDKISIGSAPVTLHEVARCFQ